MSDATSSWYARKMAQMRGGQQQPAPFQPQQQPQQRPNYYQPQAPAQPAYQPPQTTVKQGQASLTGLLEVQKQGMLEPGVGAKANPEPCPQCGSGQYFAAVDTADVKVRRGPPPNSHCFTCGYNGGLFTQGDASSWGATA